MSLKTKVDRRNEFLTVKSVTSWQVPRRCAI